MPPTANAGTAPAPYSFSALPITVPLNGSGSTVGSGASSITECVWELKSAPPGATAAILSPTSLAGAALQTDRSGTHIVRLRVKDNLNQWSAGTSAGDTNAGWPDAWESAPDSIIKIEVKEPNTGLVIKGEGEHGYIGKDYAWCKEIDRLRGQVSANTSGVAAGTAWIQAVAGDAEADGTPARPFNPTSAAAKTNPYTGLAFVGPWQQAQVALLDATLPDRRPRVIVALGGVYDEDVNISVAGGLVESDEDFITKAIPQWAIYTHGVVSFEDDRKFSFSVTKPAGDGTAVAILSIAPYETGLESFGFVLLNSDADAFGIGAVANAHAIVRFENVQANVGVKVSCNDGQITARTSSLVLAVPTVGLRADNSTIEGNVRRVDRVDRCTVGNWEVEESQGDGYFDCASIGANFTGPAGSAKFDLHTAAAFEASPGVFAGGASKSDYLKIGGKLVANDDLDIVAGDTVTVTAPNKIVIDAETGVDISTGEGTLRIGGGAGNVADMSVDVVGGIDLTAGGTVDITVTAGNLTATVTGNVDVQPTGLVNFEPGGAFLVETTDGRVDLAAQGTGKVINLTTTDGDIVIDANGTGRDVTITAADAVSVTAEAGALNLGGYAGVNIGAETSNVAISTDVGNVTISAAGSGNVTLSATGDDITLNAAEITQTAEGYRPVKASRVVQCLESKYSTTSTTGTTEELLGSYSIEDDFFTVEGMRLVLEMWFLTAGNTNNREITIKLDGNTISVVPTFSHAAAAKTVKFTVDILANAANSQRTHGEYKVEGAQSELTRYNTSVDMTTGAKTIGIYARTPDLLGDISLEQWTLTYYPTTSV